MQGWTIFQGFEKHCKLPNGGYASVRDVDALPVQHEDRMETFWLSETLKVRLPTRDGAFGGANTDVCTTRSTSSSSSPTRTSSRSTATSSRPRRTRFRSSHPRNPYESAQIDASSKEALTRLET